MTRGQRGTQEGALQSQRAIREITGHFCAHLRSWKLATPRWKKPTAMQASLVTAWSNAWGQKCPWNTQVCNPVTDAVQADAQQWIKESCWPPSWPPAGEGLPRPPRGPLGLRLGARVTATAQSRLGSQGALRCTQGQFGGSTNQPVYHEDKETLHRINNSYLRGGGVMQGFCLF